MSAILHVLRAVMESDTSEFGKNIKAAAEGTQKLGKAWEDTAKAVGQATDKVDKAAKKAARESEKLTQKAQKGLNQFNARLELLGKSLPITQLQKAQQRAQQLGESFKRGEINAEQFRAHLGALGRDAAKAARAAEQAAEKASKAIRDMGRAWLSAGQAIDRSATRIATVFGGMATAVTGVVVKVGFGFDAMKENATIAFTTMLGDGQKAVQFLEDLREFARKTPFEMPGLVQSAKRLLAFGFAAEEILPMLTAVGDAAAGLGGSPELLTNITRALGQIRAKGKVSHEEMLQLAEAGIPAWEILAQKIGVGIPQAMKMAEQGTIQASFAIPALLEGMNERFGGLMAQQSQTFTGLVSTVRDTLNQAAGQVMQPAFERIRNALKGIVDAMGGPAFQAAVNRIGQQVEGVIDRLSSQFANISPEGVIDRVSSAVGEAIRLFGLFTEAAAKAGPALLKMGQAVAKVLTPVLELIASHPGLLKVFAIWKAASILGITAAIGKLVSALWATGAALLALKSRMGMAAIAAAGLKGGIIALATGAFAFLASKIYAANSAIKDFNKSLAKSQKLSDEMQGIADKRANRIMEQGAAIADPTSRAAFFGKAVEQARKELEGLQSSRRGQEKLIAGMTSGVGGFLKDATGNKILEEERANLEDINKKLENQKRILKELEAAKLEAARASATHATATPSTPQQAAAVGPNPMEALSRQQQEADAKVAQDAAKEQAEAVQEAVRDAERDAIDRELPGFSKFRGMLDMEGMTPQQLQRMLQAQEGISPEMAGKAAGTFSHHGNSPEAMDALAMALARAAQEAQKAKQSEEELTEAKKQAQPTIQEFQRKLYDLREQGTLSKDALHGFASQAMNLRDQLFSGKISLEEFNQSMRNLESATDAATKAAQREALLKGDFKGAGLDFQKALQDRLASFRMAQFNGQVERAFQHFAKLNGLIPDVGRGFEQLRSGMDRFGERMQETSQQIGNTIQQIDPSQIAAAAAQIGNFLSSRSGMIASIQNQIALLQQNLQILDRARDRIRVEEQIASLMQTLNQLLTPAPSLVTGINPLAGIFRDPGLTGANGGPGGGYRDALTLNFHSLTRPTPEDARILVDTFEEELARRGWR